MYYLESLKITFRPLWSSGIVSLKHPVIYFAHIKNPTWARDEAKNWDAVNNLILT